MQTVRLTVFVAAISGLLFGYDLCVITGALGQIGAHFSLSTVEREAVVSSVLGAAVVGSLVGGPAAEVFGRKRTIAGFALLFAVGALVMGAAPTYGVLLTGRVVIGLAVGGAGMSVPVYLAELAPADVRGIVVAVNEVAICLGCLLAIVVDAIFARTPSGWRVMLGLAGVPAVAQLCLLTTLPRSPRWLLRTGQRDAARAALLQLRSRTEEAEAELEEAEAAMREEAKRAAAAAGEVPSYETMGAEGGADGEPGAESSSQATADASSPPPLLSRLGWSGFVRAMAERHSRWQLGLSLAVAAAQNLCAANAMLYFAADILAAAGGGDADAVESETVGVGIAKFVGVCVALALIGRTSRRRMLICGTAALAACHLLLAIVFATDPSNTRQALAGVVLYAFIFAWDLSWAPLMWVVCSELLPSEGRAIGMGLSVSCFWLSSFVVNQFLVSLAEAIGWTGTFALFSALSVLATALVYVMVPETKGLLLEEVAVVVQRILAAPAASTDAQDSTLPTGKVLLPAAGPLGRGLRALAIAVGCTCPGLAVAAVRVPRLAAPASKAAGDAAAVQETSL